MATKTRDETTLENIGLVHSIANRFRGRGIEYDDLFGAGCLGLIKAADRFDESRGLCFSTYAVPLIMGEIKSLFRKSGVVKVSRTLKEVYIKALRVSQEYSSTYGDLPTVGQIAEKLGVDEETGEEIVTDYEGNFILFNNAAICDYCGDMDYSTGTKKSSKRTVSILIF